jgi:hypothetical protein
MKCPRELVSRPSEGDVLECEGRELGISVMNALGSSMQCGRFVENSISGLALR